MIPRLALSVRQPWAWAIIHAGKDIENRSWQAANRLGFRGRIAVHAAKGMTRAEYDNASEFMRSIGVICPEPADLLRGGMIGSVEIVDIVRESNSPWFMGPRGIVLQGAEVWSFLPAIGALGFFEWCQDPDGQVAPPAKWMFSIKSPVPADIIEDEPALPLWGVA